jgi:hypothetical protein
VETPAHREPATRDFAPTPPNSGQDLTRKHGHARGYVAVGTTAVVQAGRVRRDCGGTPRLSAFPFIAAPPRRLCISSLPRSLFSYRKRVRGREASRVPVFEMTGDISS